MRTVRLISLLLSLFSIQAYAGWSHQPDGAPVEKFVAKSHWVSALESMYCGTAAFCKVEIVGPQGVGTQNGIDYEEIRYELFKGNPWESQGTHDRKIWDVDCPDQLEDNGDGCVLPDQTPEECLEQGLAYDSVSSQCVQECEHGQLGDVCLLPPEDEPDEPDCSPDHPDFKGTIGFGGEAALVCGEPEDNCPTGSTYGFTEQPGGSHSAACFPPESNPPQCSGGSALIMGDGGYSFQCETVQPPNDPDNPPQDPNDTSDGDSDGDGQGDVPGIADQLQDLKGLLRQGNTNTNNINQSIQGNGTLLENIVEAIGNIPGGGGSGSGSGDGGTGDGEGEGEAEDPITWNGNPIDMELDDYTDDYDQVMADYQNKIQEIKAEVQAMFGVELTGGGSVDDDIKMIKGVDVNFSLNRFLEGLNIIGAIVLFCAAFISAGILFTGRG